MLRRSLPTVLPWLVLLAASSVAFLLLRLQLDWDSALQWASPVGHFWVVSAAAITCLVLAIAAGLAAFQARNARVLMLSLSFLSMAGLFTVHGLATPGVLVSGDYTGSYTGAGGYGFAAGPDSAPAIWLFNLTGLSARLAVVVSAGFLAASTVEWPRSMERAIVRGRGAILGTVVGLLLLYAIVGLVRPQTVPGWLVGSVVLAWMTLASVVILGTITAVRYATGYARTGQQMFGAVALGAALLVQAQLSLHFGAIWRGTFWLYHLQLLAGFFAVLWGVVLEYSRGRAVHSFTALTVSDAVEQLRSGLTEPVLTLAAALEARDGYTLGHGERVAAMSVLVGEHLRLPGPRLRGLAAGALLHDVGKIGIPDAILHKPGSLTDEEFGIIREHPSRGWEILRITFGSDVESMVIRHHHEKWDGSGYPDRLAGEAIPLEARIAAVADVYDALRSNRSYRTPMTPVEAAAIIQRDAGVHFDPRCVEAFLAVQAQWERSYAAANVAYAERRAVPG